MMEGSSKKWWLIGCGGCLGVLVIISIALAVLAGMGVNALKEGSNGAVSGIFGKSYQPVGYMPIGLPLGSLAKNSMIQNMVMLIDKGSGRVVLAFDMPLGAFEAKLLKSHDSKKIDMYMQRMGSSLLSSSRKGSGSSRLEDISISPSHWVKLPNGKEVSLSDTVNEMSQHGQLLYGPGAIALIPEANARKVVLFSLGGKSLMSPSANIDFKPGQQLMEKELTSIIVTSELDDRLQY